MLEALKRGGSLRNQTGFLCNPFGCLQEPFFYFIYLLILLFHVITMVTINFYYNEQTEPNTK